MTTREKIGYVRSIDIFTADSQVTKRQVALTRFQTLESTVHVHIKILVRLSEGEQFNKNWKQVQFVLLDDV